MNSFQKIRTIFLLIISLSIVSYIFNIVPNKASKPSNVSNNEAINKQETTPTIANPTKTLSQTITPAPTKNRVPVLFINNSTIYCYPEGVGFVNQSVQNFNQESDKYTEIYKSCLENCSNDYKKSLDNCYQSTHDLDECTARMKIISGKCMLGCKDSYDDLQKALKSNLDKTIPTLAKYCIFP